MRLLILLMLAYTAMAADTIASLRNSINNMASQMKSQKLSIDSLTRQLMMQQLFLEERIRSDGASGIKQRRVNIDGTRPYHSETYSGGSMLSIHDHANNDRTIGMGEFIAVLNGVEFRTRHNDYRLRMPHRTSKNYHAMEDVPFPAVPPAVLNKKTVWEQIVEMREWFKAWKTQNFKVRDYRKYFKPVLCYLEGAWTQSRKTIDEPFSSDRHHIDATSWFDLTEKVRFTSYTGRKSNQENFAYLPTTISELVNGSNPLFAQWNYRIACHPLKNDLPLAKLRVQDDIHSRMMYYKTLQDYKNSRGARFQINPNPNGNNWPERTYRRNYLDTLMEQIPGKDNYQGKLVDDSFFLPAKEFSNNGKDLNTAFYHRFYRVGQVGAMGTATRLRGYSDQNVFMAQTSSPHVRGQSVQDCQQKVCKRWSQKWSWAIPLELIYLTPLASWNPYNLTYKGWANSPAGRTVTANGRNGGKTADKAYNGLRQNVYYMTPSAFYTGSEVNRDPADTARDTVGVLDPRGNMQIVRASGTRVFLPNIPGVGIMRTRYPIAPVHQDGDVVWKETQALKDVVMQQRRYAYLYKEKPLNSGASTAKPDQKIITFEMAHASRDPPGWHTHRILFTEDEVKEMETKGRYITSETTEQNAHSHVLAVRYIKNGKRFEYATCDGRGVCWDGHSKVLKKIANGF